MSVTVIQQLKLPVELQELVRSFFGYTKIEYLQRIRKETLTRQLKVCERQYWKKDGPFYDYFYYEIINWGFYTIEPTIYYITQRFQIMSVIFCKKCHNYVSADTPIPACIECSCEVDWLDVD
jgi:hypothetical protein